MYAGVMVYSKIFQSWFSLFDSKLHKKKQSFAAKMVWNFTQWVLYQWLHLQYDSLWERLGPDPVGSNLFIKHSEELSNTLSQMTLEMMWSTIGMVFIQRFWAKVKTYRVLGWVLGTFASDIIFFWKKNLIWKNVSALLKIGAPSWYSRSGYSLNFDWRSG